MVAQTGPGLIAKVDEADLIVTRPGQIVEVEALAYIQVGLDRSIHAVGGNQPVRLAVAEEVIEHVVKLVPAVSKLRPARIELLILLAKGQVHTHLNVRHPIFGSFRLDGRQRDSRRHGRFGGRRSRWLGRVSRHCRFPFSRGLSRTIDCLSLADLSGQHGDFLGPRSGEHNFGGILGNNRPGDPIPIAQGESNRLTRQRFRGGEAEEREQPALETEREPMAGEL